VNLWTDPRTRTLVSTLEGATARWAVQGGTALMLFAGHFWRRPSDLDLVIFCEDSARLDQVLEAHGARLVRVGDAGFRNFQLGGPRGNRGRYPIDITLMEADSSAWRWRRAPSVELRWEDAIRMSLGTPILAPQAVLLSKLARADTQDIADAHMVWPLLDASSRLWVRRAISAAGVDLDLGAFAE